MENLKNLNTFRGFCRSAEVFGFWAEDFWFSAFGVFAEWFVCLCLDCAKWNESPWVVSEPLWGNRPARRGFCRRAEVFALHGEVLCFWGLEYLMNGLCPNS